MTSSENGNASDHVASSSTSLTLLQRVRENDKGAWDRLVELYTPLVCAWCVQDHVPPGEIKDVYQDVITAVVANLHRFQKDASGGSFRGWLRVIVKHKAADCFRRINSQPAATGGSTAYERLQQFADPEDDSPPSSCATPEAEDEVLRKTLLRAAIDHVRADFAENSWQAVLLTVAEGRTAPEAAASLDMTHNAVRSAKSRLLRRLRAELTPRLGELADLEDVAVDEILRLLPGVLAEYLIEA